MTEVPGARRVAVVTGSSTGIGRAMAIKLAECGFDVIVHAARNVSDAKTVQKQIVQMGRNATVIPQDFAQHEALRDFVRRCRDWQNGVHVWINNAGIDVLTDERASWEFEQKLEAILQVDVTSTILLSREIGLHMKRQPTAGPRPGIINIGWDQAAQGMAGDSGEMFAASKGAIMAFSKSLAQSLAPHVRVNCIAPGWIRTEWGENASSIWQERAKNESLSNRWGLPEDVAELAAFLASSDSEFINGQVIPVNGGFRFGLDQLQ